MRAGRAAVRGRCRRRGRAHRRPPPRRLRHARAHHRPRPLRRRSGASRQPRHRRPRAAHPPTPPAGSSSRPTCCSSCPRSDAGARGTVFLEVVNRGRDQSLGLMSGARQRDLSPEQWDLGDRFVLTQGFAVAFLGWQFDVAARPGPRASRRRSRRCGGWSAPATSKTAAARGYRGFAVQYCARDPAQPDATLSFRRALDAPARRWCRATAGSSVPAAAPCVCPDGLRRRALRSRVRSAKGRRWPASALPPIRDFASYLKFGASGGERDAARTAGARPARARVRLLAERPAASRVRARRLQRRTSADGRRSTG